MGFPTKHHLPVNSSHVANDKQKSTWEDLDGQMVLSWNTIDKANVT